MKILSTSQILFLVSIAILASVYNFLCVQTFLLNPQLSAHLVLAHNYLNGMPWNDTLSDKEQPLTIFFLMVPHILHALMPPISTADFTTIYILIIVHASIYSSWRIMQYAPSVFAAKSFHILITMYFVFGFYGQFQVRADFGQREYLCSLLITPYILNCISYLNNIITPRKYRIILAIMASIGVSFKPHFALIFIFSECFIVIYKRHLRSAVRLENIIIAIIASIYLGSWMLFYPQYFAEAKIYMSNSSVLLRENLVSLLHKTIIFSVLPFGLLAYFYTSKSTQGKYLHWYFIVLFLSTLLVIWLQFRGYPQQLFITIYVTFLFALFANKYNNTLSLIIIWFIVTCMNSNPAITFPLKKENGKELRGIATSISDHVQKDELVILTNSVIMTWTVASLIDTSISAPVRNFHWEKYILDRLGDCCNAPNKLLPHETFFRNKAIQFVLAKQPKWILVLHQMVKQPYDRINIIKPLLLDPTFLNLWNKYSLQDQYDFQWFDGGRGTFLLYQRTN